MSDLPTSPRGWAEAAVAALKADMVPDDQMCVCGHPKSDHLCPDGDCHYFLKHDDQAPTWCDCMQFMAATETATPDPDRPCIHCGKPEPEHYAYARGCTLLNDPGPLENCYYKPTPLSSSEVEALAEKIAKTHLLGFISEEGTWRAQCDYCGWVHEKTPPNAEFDRFDLWMRQIERAHAAYVALTGGAE